MGGEGERFGWNVLCIFIWKISEIFVLHGENDKWKVGWLALLLLLLTDHRLRIVSFHKTLNGVFWDVGCGVFSIS